MFCSDTCRDEAWTRYHARECGILALCVAAALNNFSIIAVRALASEADLTLVVGSKNSSNSVRLTEISANTGAGTPAYLVDDKTELKHEWFENVDSVLLTAGASAPEHLVQEIVEELINHHGGEVSESHVVEEDVHFNLPRSLRVLQTSQV